MGFSYWEDYHERNSDPEEVVVNEYSITIQGGKYSSLNAAYRFICPDSVAYRVMKPRDKVKAIKEKGGIVKRRQRNCTTGELSEYVTL